jgi:hypothetical protein
MTLPLINPDKPTVSTSGFGRVFFAGGSTLYYSPVLEQTADLGRCYQVNDPTSDENSDLLDTDGGALKLQDAGQIIDIAVYRIGILVFTNRGVWYVYNGETGFRSTSYQVSKISEEVLLNQGAYVEAQGIMYFATPTDINVIVPNEFDNLSVNSLTDDTILSYYKNLVETDIISPVYDRANSQIWFNCSDCSLVRDLRANAWYPQQFVGDRGIPDSLYIDNEVLFVNSKLYGLNTVNYNFAKNTNTLFQDFGTDIQAYLVSGFETLGKFSHKKASTYGSFFFQKTETQVTAFDENTMELVFDLPSSCTLQLRWDFDSSNAYDKWVTVTGNLYQPMKRGFIPPDEDDLPWSFDTGEQIVSKKTKLRGNGKAVQFRFDAEPEKDLQLLGYSVEYTMRGRQ